MRVSILAIAGLAAAAVPAAAPAATIIVYADPMTLERRTVVVDPEGPDRAYFCMLPPGLAGCREIPVKRAR